MRTFTDTQAQRTRVPLLLGLAGPSGSGKTYSALRLATGIQRVTGGDIFVIDTEAKRALHYADKFRFRHVDFQPPFGPLDYLAAIHHCVAQGAKVLVIDSMTHEHNGVGGVMDQSADFLDRTCGDDDKARDRKLMLSLIKPKKDRRRLNTAIVQLGINAVFCYRAHEKIKPVPGQQPKQLGWQPETTSPLVYDMAVRFLLAPGSDGRVTVNSDAAPEERLLTKRPEFSREWYQQDTQLTEDLGERIARWGAGAQPNEETDIASQLAALAIAPDESALNGLLARLREMKGLTKPQKLAIKDASEVRRAELQNPSLDAELEPGADG